MVKEPGRATTDGAEAVREGTRGGWDTHDNLLIDDMCSALMVSVDEMGQDARDDGRGGQDQGVIERQPCS